MGNFNYADIDQYHNSEHPSPTNSEHCALEGMGLFMHVAKQAAEHVASCLFGLLRYHKK